MKVNQAVHAVVLISVTAYSLSKDHINLIRKFEQNTSVGFKSTRGRSGGGGGGGRTTTGGRHSDGENMVPFPKCSFTS